MVCMCVDLILKKKVCTAKYKASFQMSSQIFTIRKASVFSILERSAVIILTAYLKMRQSLDDRKAKGGGSCLVVWCKTDEKWEPQWHRP